MTRRGQIRRGLWQRYISCCVLLAPRPRMRGAVQAIRGDPVPKGKQPLTLAQWNIAWSRRDISRSAPPSRRPADARYEMAAAINDQLPLAAARAHRENVMLVAAQACTRHGARPSAARALARPTSIGGGPSSAFTTTKLSGSRGPSAAARGTRPLRSPKQRGLSTSAACSWPWTSRRASTLKRRRPAINPPRPAAAASTAEKEITAAAARAVGKAVKVPLTRAKAKARRRAIPRASARSARATIATAMTGSRALRSAHSAHLGRVA